MRSVKPNVGERIRDEGVMSDETEKLLRDAIEEFKQLQGSAQRSRDAVATS